MALVALGVTGAKAQSLTKVKYRGDFTLPFQAQWGAMTLPAGDYTLQYGRLEFSGPWFVEIAGTIEGSPHGLILTRTPVEAAGTKTKNAIVCVRQGGVGIVRTLNLPEIGRSISFKMPHGLQLVTRIQDGYTNTLLAGGPLLVQRVPITAGAK